jgi:hypothetical protein
MSFNVFTTEKQHQVGYTPDGYGISRARFHVIVENQAGRRWISEQWFEDEFEALDLAHRTDYSLYLGRQLDTFLWRDTDPHYGGVRYYDRPFGLSDSEQHRWELQYSSYNPILLD